MDIDLTINCELVRNILTGFIRSEITRTGLSRAVIGLSGGLDSSLACYLAAEALGPQNVLALLMPYRTSAPDSLMHGEEVVRQTGVQSLLIPVTPMVDPLLEQYPDMSNLRKGNIMARQRMIILYDQSSVFNGLVVGTSNKTEILLGYSTVFGDSASALNPLGDLYKTQIRQLSHEIGLPESIIQKPPSADLWKGQTDEGDLGFTYSDVDRLLYLLVDRRFSAEECIQLGFEEGFVSTVLQRMQRYHYKRVMPPIAKLSNRTIGYDFLYLRDWGT